MANLPCIHIPEEVFQSSEGNSEPSRASGMVRFFKKLLMASFCNKSSIVDVRLGSKCTSIVAFLYSICVIRILT